MLTLKSKEVFEKWLEKQEVAPYKIMFWDIPKIVQSSYITEWFDTVGITVDVMPRMADENKIVFEPNTFCLKHEITTEDVIQFDNRLEAKIKAIEKANEIYNEYFVAK
jgi:hypothetical protein